MQARYRRIQLNLLRAGRILRICSIHALRCATVLALISSGIHGHPEVSRLAPGARRWTPTALSDVTTASLFKGGHFSAVCYDKNWASPIPEKHETNSVAAAFSRGRL